MKEYRRATEKHQWTQNMVFKKMNKIDKPLRLTKKKKRKPNCRYQEYKRAYYYTFYRQVYEPQAQ